MSVHRERSGLAGMAAAAGAALLMVACCAGPLLLASGALGGVGGTLGNPWLITVGAVVLLLGIGYVLRCRARRRHGAGPEDCCPTAPAQPADRADHQHPLNG
ncbi:mercury transporter [Streptomyces sp. bgisy060]|uniref:mercury transporter n=1 Tax=Streptomyces sp. bgisy060 TaxID=3413775 RepID=UPI003EB97178